MRRLTVLVLVLMVTPLASAGPAETDDLGVPSLRAPSPSGCAIEVVSPNGGEVLYVWSVNEIVWRYDNTACPEVKTVGIEWTPGGVSGPWHVITSGVPLDRPYPWQIPRILTSTDTHVRLTMGAYSDTNNASFTVQAYGGGSSCGVGTVVKDGDTGRDPSVAAKGSTVYIAFTDATADELKFASGGPGNWQIETIASGASDASLQLLDTGEPIASYHLRSQGEIRVGWKRGGTWYSSVVASGVGPGPLKTSLQIGGNSTSHVAWDGKLSYATDRSGTWQVADLSFLAADSAGVSLAIDSTGRPHLSYIDLQQDRAEYATIENGSWISRPATGFDQQGVETKIRVDINDVPYVATFYDPERVPWPSGFGLFSRLANGSWDNWSAFGLPGPGTGSFVIDSNGRVHLSSFWYYGLSYGAMDESGGGWAGAIDEAEPVPGAVAVDIFFDEQAGASIVYYEGWAGDLRFAQCPPFQPGRGLPWRPMEVEATAGDGQVDLTWHLPFLQGRYPVTRYRVYRTSSPWDFKLLAQVYERSYLDATAKNGVEYYYYISAVNAVGEGEMGSSGNVSARPTPKPPRAPQNLSGKEMVGAIDLAWNPPLSDSGFIVTSYRIYRAEVTGPSILVDEVDALPAAKIYAYSDRNLTSEVEYVYEVSAVNEGGEGPRSSEFKGFASPQHFTVAGRVIDTMGKPIRGAMIEAFDLRTSLPAGDRLTNSTGAFDFYLAGGHSYLVRANASGRVAELGPFILNSDMQLIITLGKAPEPGPTPPDPTSALWLASGAGIAALIASVIAVLAVVWTRRRLASAAREKASASVALPDVHERAERPKPRPGPPPPPPRAEAADDRTLVLEAVPESPGATLAEIRAASGLSTTVLLAHLRALQRDGVVAEETHGGMRRFVRTSYPEPAEGRR